MKNFYIEEKKDGGVRYRMSYKDPLTGKTKRVTTNYDHDSVRNRRKAEEELSKKIDSIVNNVDLSNRLLRDTLEDYYTDTLKTLKLSTVRRNKATLGRVIAKLPKDTILQNVTPAKWKAVISELSHDVPGTYNEYVKRIKRFLRWCYDNDYINDINTIEKITTLADPGKKSRIADKYLEPEEVTILLNQMEGMQQWQLLTQFMILTGMRIGEALALEWTDITSNNILVNKTLDPKEKITTTPKTITSVREVSIQEELRECIDSIRAYDDFVSKANRYEDILLFPNKEGKYINYFAYNKFLRENAEKCLTKKVTTHTLRHTHVSLLFAAGVPLDMISRRVGHINSRITKEIYLHITQKVKDRDADFISKIRLI